MKILGIDTTGLVASCAIVDENKTIAAYSTNFKKTHSQTILPMIDEMLSMTGIALSEIGAIACSNGPGSFTGLRIGIATAQGLARASGKKIIPVPTLDAMAYNILDSGKVIAPVMDARRNQVYSALYRYEDYELIRTTEFIADDISVIFEEIDKTGRQAIFLGDGVPVHKESIISKGHQIAPPHLNMQRAEAVAALAQKKLSAGEAMLDPGKLTAFYLRLSQAERLMENISEVSKEK